MNKIFAEVLSSHGISCNKLNLFMLLQSYFVDSHARYCKLKQTRKREAN